eukprot:1619676-Lingulodinium_polyedra.AAC.1
MPYVLAPRRNDPTSPYLDAMPTQSPSAPPTDLHAGPVGCPTLHHVRQTMQTRRGHCAEWPPARQL